jgi:prepilin-type N-terminal cleavage/methylation domain-containing protein
MPERKIERRKKFRLRPGFTLIELLMVVAIIGILIGIALLQLASYRSRTIDAEMKSDLRNAAVAMESYFAEHRVYPSSVSGITAVGFRQTNGVALTITIISASSFTLTAAKAGGTQASFTYDSTTGLIN